MSDPTSRDFNTGAGAISAPWANLLIRCVCRYAIGKQRSTHNDDLDAGDDWSAYRRSAPVATAALMTAIFVTAPCAAEGDATVADAEVLAITHKHCVACHAAKPTHVAFQEAPKNVTLETIADLRKYAALVYLQTVQNKIMPLGNETAMTADERNVLGRWLKARP